MPKKTAKLHTDNRKVPKFLHYKSKFSGVKVITITKLNSDFEFLICCREALNQSLFLGENFYTGNNNSFERALRVESNEAKIFGIE